MRKILAYLSENPDAQDTLDGILQWWLLRQEITYQSKLVREALAELVEKGLLLEVLGADSRTHYRRNKSKNGEIRTLLENDPL